MLSDVTLSPRGYKEATCNLTFEVKIDFIHKARWVLDGHKTPSHIVSDHAGVASRECVRI